MPFLVPDVLPLSVPLDGCGVLLAVLAPVFPIAGTPLLRAVKAHLAIHRVGSDFPAVIFSAAAPLAIGLATDRLPRPILRWHEDPTTVTASPFGHTTGRCRT
jgi:hypothetical protein